MSNDLSAPTDAARAPEPPAPPPSDAGPSSAPEADRHPVAAAATPALLMLEGDADLVCVDDLCVPAAARS